MPSNHELAERLAQLERENAQLKAANAAKVTLKVSEKGAISVYGLGRWPTTLYATQMHTLLDSADAIRAFMAANAHRLATKPTALKAGETRAASGAILGGDESQDTTTDVATAPVAG